jgi:hypothetical protein
MSPHSESENFGLDKFSGQGYLKFDSDTFASETEFKPKWTARVFPTLEERKTKESNLLAILKRADSHKSKRDLAHALYPKAFDSQMVDQSQSFWDGYRFVRCAEVAENKYLIKTGALIRSVHQNIRNKLAEMDSESQKLDYLRTVSLPIPIDESDDGEALYIYHGPDRPAPMEYLSSFIEWATIHQAKQSQPLELANKLQTAYYNQSNAQIDNDFHIEFTDLLIDGLQENI